MTYRACVQHRWAGFCAVVICLAGLQSAKTDVLSWTAVTGDWFEVNNWTNLTSAIDTRVPADGDDVVISIAGAYVSLTNSPAQMGSLAISNASLVFSNWDTLLSATNVTVLNKGVLTCEGLFTNTMMSNRVNLVCTNLLIESGGSINVQAKGFRGGIGPGYGRGNGPGGRSSIHGAGHGGMGPAGQSLAIPSNTYGSATAPMEPGSGGSGGNNAGQLGGHGGGAVRIDAVAVVVNGSINADATLNPVDGVHNSGGSGGSVYITCRTITGTNGTITANGGNAGSLSWSLGAGGGGGRIAILYDTLAQAGISPAPTFRCSATGGRSAFGVALGAYCPAELGTLYFSDSLLFSPSNLFSGEWLAPGLPAKLTLSDWTVSNVWLRIPGLNVTVSNTLSIVGTNYPPGKYGQFRLEMTNAGDIACSQLVIRGATLSLGASVFPFFYPNRETMSGGQTGSSLTCSGSLVLTNGGRLFVFAGLTNPGTASDFGAQVTVGGDLVTYSNTWIYPVAHPTNGAAPLFSVSNMTVGRYGGFNADFSGFAGGVRTSNAADSPAGARALGPGVTNYSAGSGHGGWGTRGGYGGAISGQTYGSASAPVLPGSGARCGYTTSTYTPYYGPWGGGSVQIRAAGTVAISGLISANGATGTGNCGPASSGGSIYITCNTFIGNTSGALQAKGADGLSGIGAGNVNISGGGGGGGRIAVWRINDNTIGLISNDVSGGRGFATNATFDSCLTAGPGTIVWGWLPAQGTIIRFR